MMGGGLILLLVVLVVVVFALIKVFPTGRTGWASIMGARTRLRRP
jgi:hypothetical protein